MPVFSVGLPERSKGAVCKTVVRRFESGTPLQFFLLTVAQLEERPATIREAADSNSAGGAIHVAPPYVVRCAPCRHADGGATFCGIFVRNLSISFAAAYADTAVYPLIPNFN